MRAKPIVLHRVHSLRPFVSFSGIYSTCPHLSTPPSPGFDTQRPVVFEHSKKLLTNLVVVLACRDDKVAAAQARMMQRELSLRSPSASSLFHIDEGPCPARESVVMSTESLNSIADEVPEESRLTAEARDLIEFVSKW